MSGIVRLGIVTDIHHGPDEMTKRGSAALALLDRALTRAAEARVDAVIDLGDRISDHDAEVDPGRAHEVGARFVAAGLPRHHLCGNHDRAHLSAAQNAAALAAEIGSRVVDVAGLRLVLWEPEVRTTPARGPHLGAGDLEWLSDALRDSDAPTLLFSHVPLSGQAMGGNYWFEHHPTSAVYRQQPAIRGVLREARCPLAAFAGHVHWNSLTMVDAVAHVTLQSLTETFTTAPDPAGSFGLLEVGAGTLRWSVEGNDALGVVLPWPAAAASGHRRNWIAPRS